MSKGSTRRPAQVTLAEWSERWEQTFGDVEIVHRIDWTYESHSHSEGLDSKLPQEAVSESVNRSED